MALANEIIAFRVEVDQGGEVSEEEKRKRYAAFVESASLLNATQLRALIEEFRHSTELSDSARTTLIFLTMGILTADHPAMAVRVLTGELGAKVRSVSIESMLADSMASWGRKDPTAAMEWVRENAAKFPDLVTDEIKAELVKGAGEKSIALAMGLISELGFKNPEDALKQLASTSESPAERKEFVNQLRAFIEKSESVETQKAAQRSLQSLAGGITEDGFEAGSAWIEENLLPNEMSELARYIGFESNNRAERRQWIDWMAKNLPNQGSNPRFSEMVGDWTRVDYVAAGEWLVSQPAGNTKNLAISAYATEVAPYDPQAAVDWALTMPAGQARQEVFSTILKKWPKEDSQQIAERKVFAEKYGIK
ncbi:hypothetical protein [Haloferula sp.]|uniref:hypothetical protein n=1 Tax=Haloferula sp. TaxID=2497595 RepID=UPI003C760D9F